MSNTDLEARESIFESRKTSIKAHLDMLIQKSERQIEELKMLRKRMDNEEHNIISILEMSIEYVENTDWHLSRAVVLTYDYLRAKMNLEEEENRLSRGDM